MDVHQYHEIAELDALNWWYVARRSLVHSLLSRYVSTDGAALDLGCGTGAHAGLLQKHAGRITGVDPSEDALRHASVHGYDALVKCGAESLPLPNECFTLVLATDVLEHVDDEAAVAEIHRVLVPGGHAVVTVPAYMSLWHGNDDHSHHLRRYSKNQLRDLFIRNGFDVEYIRHWNRTFFIPVWIAARFYTKGTHELKNNLSGIPTFLNPILSAWMMLENAVCRFLPLPFGVSLALVAKKR